MSDARPSAARNVAAVIARHADRCAESPALAYAGVQLDYGAFAAEARQVAGALAAAGIGRGDVVGLLLHNRLELLTLLYGTAWIGAVAMPLNWRLAPRELAYILGHSRARMLVTEPALEALVEPVRDERAGPLLVSVERDDGNGWTSWATLRSGADPAPEDPVPVTGHELHRLMYTSGTTSHPKGVMVSHDNLTWKNVAHHLELEISPEDRGLACGPLYHVGALDLTTTTLLYGGASSVVLPRFEATALLDAIERHATTVIWLAPAMVNMILAHPSLPERDLSSVRLLIGGGEKMPLSLVDRIEAAFPSAWFADAYGLTETVSGDSFLGRAFARTKTGSVGKAVPHHEIAVLDEDGARAPAGEVGEIVVRGPKVTAGYWDDDEASKRALRDGWLHTGDLGMLDEDGFLFVVDRLKDVIISGGENVASLEVERVLYEHGDVLEAAVVARPHERWNEVPVAYVALRPGAEPDGDALRAFCRERLAPFKVPAHVRFIASLPRNPSGKVLKRTLREQEAQIEGVAS